MIEEDVTFQLSTLPETRSDAGDLEMERISVDARIEGDVAGDDAGTDVGGVVGVNRAVDAELALLTLRGEIEASDAFGSAGIAGGRLQQLQVEFALRRGGPMRVRETLQFSGDV